MQIILLSPRLKSSFEEVLKAEVFLHFQISNRIEYQRFDEQNTMFQQRSNKFVNDLSLMLFQNFILIVLYNDNDDEFFFLFFFSYRSPQNTKKKMKNATRRCCKFFGIFGKKIFCLKNTSRKIYFHDCTKISKRYVEMGKFFK